MGHALLFVLPGSRGAQWGLLRRYPGEEECGRIWSDTLGVAQIDLGYAGADSCQV